MHGELENVMSISRRLRVNLLIATIVASTAILISILLVFLGVNPDKISPGILGVACAISAVFAAWKLDTLHK